MWLVQYVKKEENISCSSNFNSNMILRLVSKLTALSYQMRHDTDSKMFSYIKQIKLCVYMIIYNQMT